MEGKPMRCNFDLSPVQGFPTGYEIALVIIISKVPYRTAHIFLANV